MGFFVIVLTPEERLPPGQGSSPILSIAHSSSSSECPQSKPHRGITASSHSDSWAVIMAMDDVSHRLSVVPSRTFRKHRAVHESESPEIDALMDSRVLTERNLPLFANIGDLVDTLLGSISDNRVVMVS